MGRVPCYKMKLGRTADDRKVAPPVVAPNRVQTLGSPRVHPQCAPKARRKRAEGASAARRLPPPLRGLPVGVRCPDRTPMAIRLLRSQTGLRGPATGLLKSVQDSALRPSGTRGRTPCSAVGLLHRPPHVLPPDST